MNLTICSPYRDLEYQQMLFNRKIKRYMNRGMSYMEAYQLSSQAVTVPGASEHQIGLALDIVPTCFQSLTPGATIARVMSFISVPLLKYFDGYGISTVCASATPFGLTLAPG